MYLIVYIFFYFTDFRHNITVQPSPTMRPEIVGLRMPASPESPPASPNLPRLRAYACKYGETVSSVCMYVLNLRFILYLTWTISERDFPNKKILSINEF